MDNGASSRKGPQQPYGREMEGEDGVPQTPPITTISTVVVHRPPIKVVIALLQTGETFQIKVVELEPNLSFLGKNLDEAVLLQRQHDELLVKLQGLPNPIEELLHKVDEMNETRRPRVEILHAMEDSISHIWKDLEDLLQRRKRIADINSNFHEKLVTCQSKIDALELACRDTMIPMEVEPVEEFLHKFRALRTDVLAAVMATLKDGKDLLTMLREIASEGSLDSRPDHLVFDAIQAIKQVENLLEDLHDRRNALETAWQSRCEQLEQCLKLALLSKEVDELQMQLSLRMNAMELDSLLGDSQKNAEYLLHQNGSLKRDAIEFRDKALRLTKSTEQVVESGSFSNEETCFRAYSLLSRCTDFYAEKDRREILLQQSVAFFVAAEAALVHVSALEKQIKDIKALPLIEAVQEYTKVQKEINEATAKPIQMGYCIIDEVGPDLPGVLGVKRVVDEIMSRKTELEKFCMMNAEHEINVSEKITVFFSRHNEILSWLISNAEEFVKTVAIPGTNLISVQDFINKHYKLLSDLEAKGNDINELLRSLTPILENLSDKQRLDVDMKVESLHTHWIKLKNVAKNRTELASLYIQFLDESESLDKVFNEVELIIRTAANEENLKQIDKAWDVIRPAFQEIKQTGARVIEDLAKVSDPYFGRESVRSNVEEILDRFRKQQFTITDSCDSWSKIMTEKREIEILWERTMSNNVQTLNVTSKIDENLYPILTIPSEDPSELKVFVQKRLQLVKKTIDDAKAELQERIKSTSHLEPSNDETNRKLHQVIDNLQSINSKLETLNMNYHTLITAIVSFLDSIISTKKRIDDYFDTDAEAKTSTRHDQFRQSTMEQFRSLISQSETVIQRIRDQEPEKVNDHDTDRIITLLEHLRIMFESRADSKQNELTEFNVLNQFKTDIREIHSTLDDLTKQLSDADRPTQEEDYSSVLARSRLFEYLEQTIEMTGAKIDRFVNSSDNVSAMYPKLEEFISSERSHLQSRWSDLLQASRNCRVLIDSSASYFKLLEKIKQRSSDHNNRLQEITSRAAFVNDSEEAKTLIRLIDEYIDHHETNQLNTLRQLSNVSRDVFGFDKTVSVYSENIIVFDTFLKAKAKLVEFLKEIEAKKIVSENQKNVTPAQQPPIFYQGLQDGHVLEGNQFVFKCAVRGMPTPNCEWFKDGILIQNTPDLQTTFNNGLCTLTIEETLLADSANYHCRATNSSGQDETFAQLHVTENIAIERPQAPVFTVPLCTGHVKETDSFAFQVVVTGHPLPVVQWFKNDICIDQVPDYTITFNNGQATLRIDEVCLEDQATFMCRAKNPAGNAETTAKLFVQQTADQEPVFIQPLSNVMARVGQKLKLDCVVTGRPELKLTWKQNNRPILNPDIQITFDGAKGSLTISEPLLKDSGEYTVTATNDAGVSLSTCTVIVKGRIPNETSDSEFASDLEPIKPSVQMPLQNASVNYGQSIRLDCIILGQPEPEVIWYHNGRPVKESKDVRLQFHGDRCSLHIHEALVEDCGEYKVVAINSAGEISSQCQLTVIKAVSTQEEAMVSMRFVKLLTDILVREGERIELECSMVAVPVPQVTWLFNNKPIPDEPRFMIMNGGNGIHKLVIDQALSKDGGLYTVRASNPSGDIKSFSHVIVKSVNQVDNFDAKQEIVDDLRFICPSFKELFSDQLVVEGASAKFECIVIGKPTPKIKWLFNDLPMQGREFLISTSGDRQVVSIPEVSRTTTGKVSCIAENEVGKATCVAYLSLVQLDPNGQLCEANPESQTFTQEHNTESSLVTISKQTFVTTQHQHVDSVDNQVSQMHIYSRDIPVTFEANSNKQVLEYSEMDDGRSNIQEKAVVSVINIEDNKTTPGDVAPRFITPLTGNIVDQFSDVTMEAVVDGYPTPDIRILKNSQPLCESSNCAIRFQNNKVTILLQRVGVEAAGRYSCIASNSAGTSRSVADVVVKKTIAPPVFSRRLQTQIVKVGEGVVMDVVIAGLPEPEVHWFKDDLPISSDHPRYQLQQINNSHKLIIEKTTKSDAGKFTVRAHNPGGNAESIASFAVVDSTPDRIVEVVKTVVFEDPIDKKRKNGTPDLHGKSESVHTTETRRVVEATMRMEHKKVQDKDDLAMTFNRRSLPPFTYNPPLTNESSHQSNLQTTKSIFEKKIQFAESEGLLQAPRMTSQFRSVSAKKERPQSDIYSDIYLEPGPEPEFCYAPKPKLERKKSLVETLEESIAKQLETEPSVIPPGGVRLIPMKQEQKKAYSVPFEIRKPDTPLEPLPFTVVQPPPINQKPIVGPPATPSRFIKGAYSDTNYESDFSDYSYFEKKFRHVTPPRPRSTEISQTRADQINSPMYHFTTMPLKKMIQEGSPIPLPTPTTYPASQKSRPASGYIADTEDLTGYQSNSENRIFNQEVSTSSFLRNTSSSSKQIKISEEPLLAAEVSMLPSGGKSPQLNKPIYRHSDNESDFEGSGLPTWRTDVSKSEPKYRPVVFARPANNCQHNEESQPRTIPIYKPSDKAGNWQNHTTTYYKGVAGQPIQNAIETFNSMQMHERSETNQRVVNVQSTTKIINFNNQLYGDPVPFPFLPDSSDQGSQMKFRGPPPGTPTKFVKGDFRETDYESDIHSAIIRPLWTPLPSESNDPHYRPVNAPRVMRSASCPRSQQTKPAISPMEFDTQPPYNPMATYSTQTLDRSTSKQQKAATTMKHVQANANIMSDHFKLKTQNFIGGFETQKVQDVTTKLLNEPQVARDGSRNVQYGTKHIDPNTGLIYFKYDFGYEFGILFPGEGKKFLGESNRMPLHTRTSDIEVPVTHEHTQGARNEDKTKRYSLPIEIDIDHLHDKNYRIPHTGRDALMQQSSKERHQQRPDSVPVNFEHVHPKRPPTFITPLKNIAVVSGAPARFECIVQCETTPDIVWRKDGNAIVCRSPKHIVEYRNGVCRLSLFQTTTGDGGIYSCTASNQLGSATTTADLLVPASKWGTRFQ